MTDYLTDNCGCVACQFITRDPHHPWPPEHVDVVLPDGRTVSGIYWPKYARVSVEVDGMTYSTTLWQNVNRHTVRLDTMPKTFHRSRSARHHHVQ